MTVLACSVPAQAQSIRQTVTSDAPSAVSVTVYRNPDRSASTKMNLQYLHGYALITEQRTIDLPVGEVDLRFEGVAGGIIPQSAIVTGLPDGVLEKNRDAALLSPSALLNGHIGRRVTVRRTSAETGQIRQYDADVRTDASNGVVLQTSGGFEAMRCTGLNEALVYNDIPEGLSAKPTLSVRSRVISPTRATVTLSYLATGFDWQANYVADISPDGRTLNLFSWVTLANGDETSFINAQTQTVAGQPNKEEDDIEPPTGGAIALRCWPQGTTSDIAVKRFDNARFQRDRLGKAMPAPMMAMEVSADEVIMVTGSRVTAEQEELGDLKLYRIPVPVTVASQSQKQVAFLEKTSVPFERIYEGEIWTRNVQDSLPMDVTLRLQNEKRDNLGVPLPAGRLVVFREAAGERLLAGEGSLEDKAVGEEVDITISESPLVRFSVEQLSDDEGDDRRYRDMKVTLTNASSSPAPVELVFSVQDTDRLTKVSRRLGRKNGRPLWKVTVPANGEISLSYRLVNTDR